MSMNDYKIVLTAADLQVLNAALMEMPYKIAAPLVHKVNAQIQAAHDQRVDALDIPSGATVASDPYRGD
jgi:prophage tail gpP-like protein